MVWSSGRPSHPISRTVVGDLPGNQVHSQKMRGAGFRFAQLAGNAPGFDIMDRMKRHEGPQTPYEVYCYNCRVTSAAGTSRCVHCGGRLGGRAQRGGAAVVTELPDGDELAARGLARRKPRR